MRGRPFIFLAFWIIICQDGAAKVNEAYVCHSGHKNLIYWNTFFCSDNIGNVCNTAFITDISMTCDLEVNSKAELLKGCQCVK